MFKSNRARGGKKCWVCLKIEDLRDINEAKEKMRPWYVRFRRGSGGGRMFFDVSKANNFGGESKRTNPHSHMRNRRSE